MLITSTTFIHDSFMMNSTLSSIASSNASNRIITPSTTIIIEISMMNATIPSIIIRTLVYIAVGLLLLLLLLLLLSLLPLSP